MNQSIMDKLTAKKTFSQEDVKGILELGRLAGQTIGFRESAKNYIEIATQLKDTGKAMLEQAMQMLEEAKACKKVAETTNKEAEKLAKKIANS